MVFMCIVTFQYDDFYMNCFQCEGIFQIYWYAF